VVRDVLACQDTMIALALLELLASLAVVVHGVATCPVTLVVD
jgi:hypothetical protein